MAPLAMQASPSQCSRAGPLNLRSVSAPTGIGFKACFTIAGQIFISSNGFSFMLDKEGLLLVPIWVEPPDFPGGSSGSEEPAGRGGTAMYLKCLPSVDAGQAFKQIDKLNAGTLCFLRKLR